MQDLRWWFRVTAQRMHFHMNFRLPTCDLHRIQSREPFENLCSDYLQKESPIRLQEGKTVGLSVVRMRSLVQPQWKQVV